VRTTRGGPRAAGRAICREAERRGADAVLLVSIARRRHADAVFGRTTEYVLRHAPCDVVVLHLPNVTTPEAVKRARAERARAWARNRTRSRAGSKE
jgi:hypothetical protein